MGKKTLQLQQLDNKMRPFASLQKSQVPTLGWIKTIRRGLGISLSQLGKKLSVTKQNIRALEQREKDGAITLKSLKDVANAMDMQFFYCLLPKDGSIDSLIERKARELAMQIVMRTSNTMKLEDQENSKQRIEKAIEERATQIKNEMPKTLWD